MTDENKNVSNCLKVLTRIISETNGISLHDTLDLAIKSHFLQKTPELHQEFQTFKKLLFDFQRNLNTIEALLDHTVGLALFEFFRNCPLPFNEEHIHLTGSLDSEFLLPRLNQLLAGPLRSTIQKEVDQIYGPTPLPFQNAEQLDKLIRVGGEDRFDQYLKILYLPKLVMTDKTAHIQAAYHLAKQSFEKYNVGRLRMKYSYSRAASTSGEKIPGASIATSEDALLGLYEGFTQYQKENSKFRFIISPSFRKENDYFDSQRYASKQEDFLAQVEHLLSCLDRYPELQSVVTEVDTVGNESDFYSKKHFNEMKLGFRKLQYRGFKIRSHHGEIWKTLRKGIQAVDNAMNIWRVDTVEHGLSLGINPNYYFHSLFQKIMAWNQNKEALRTDTIAYHEVCDLEWGRHSDVRDLLLKGIPLTTAQENIFVKIKFHMAREVESYQHDVLNRMLTKEVSLVALPSSNKKLTGYVEDFKDHPFSWWEKKGIQLGVGTDNYVTLDTNFIREMLILLFTDPSDLKITKLLMVTTGERRRPYLSHTLWQMRKKILGTS